MAKKLNTYVHAVQRDDQGNVTNSGVFGPDDDLSGDNAWATKAITNPDVWADGDDDDPDDEDTHVIQSPTGGTGLEGSTSLNYDELHPQALRAEARRRELPATGSKDELVERLRADDRERSADE
jgi:hypothetical protein